MERKLPASTFDLFGAIQIRPPRLIAIPKPLLRVLITAGLLGYGGSAFVVRNLAQALQKRGVFVRIGAMTATSGLMPEGLSQDQVRLLNLAETRKALATVDIVHNHNPIANWLNLFTDLPFVFHDHGSPTVNSLNIRLSYEVSTRLFAQRFAKVVSVSEFGRRELRRRFGISNAQTIYNGVDLSKFKKGLQPRFKIGNPQLLFVGSLYPHKNVQELVLATKLLSRTFPQVKLTIVGTGSAYHGVRRTAIDLGISDSVRFCGRVGEDELPYHYSSCDVYVSASKYEACPLPLFESMACGKPVVASSIPAHLELLRASHAGLPYESGNTHDLANQVVRAVTHPEASEEAGIAFVQAYDWPLVADRVIDLYRQTLISRENQI